MKPSATLFVPKATPRQPEANNYHYVEQTGPPAAATGLQLTSCSRALGCKRLLSMPSPHTVSVNPLKTSR